MGNREGMNIDMAVTIFTALSENLASEMVAASKEEMWSSVRKCSSGFPFTIHRQQIDSCYVVLMSTYSSANTEKYGLDVKLLINFPSNQVSMASSSITAENLDVY